VLENAHGRLLNAFANDEDAGPAAVWLLDNYYVVQEQLQEVRAGLPRGYYRELPELASGPLTGYPRVYEIAITLISHTEARIDLENVDLFVEAFQSVTSLSIGELWAMPAMLRLGLIESVRRMTLRTVRRLDERELAAHWAERIPTTTSRRTSWRVCCNRSVRWKGRLPPCNGWNTGCGKPAPRRKPPSRSLPSIWR
jgi:cyclic beta-1,2-glucan synthetase